MAMKEFDGSTLREAISDVLSKLSEGLSKVTEDNPLSIVDAEGKKVLATVTEKNGVYTYTVGDSNMAVLDVNDVGQTDWVIDGSGTSNDKLYYINGVKVELNAGDGNDSIDAHGAVKGSVINGGEGNNWIQLDGRATGVTDYYAAEDGLAVVNGQVQVATGILIQTGNGNDTVVNAMTDTVQTTGGDDVIVSLNSHTAGDTGNVIAAGSGADSVVAGNGDLIDLGAGLDTVDITQLVGAAGAAAGVAETVTVSSYDSDRADVIQVTSLVDVLDVENVAWDDVNQQANGNGNLRNNGTVTNEDAAKNMLGTALVGTEKDRDNYSAVLADATSSKINVYWAGSRASEISASGALEPVYMVGSTNDFGDNIVGGTGNDTIVIGEDDTINGGAGDDSFYVDRNHWAGGTGAHIVFNTSSGNDTVSNFISDVGTADDVVNVEDGLAQLSAGVSGKDVVLRSGASASLRIVDLANKSYWGVSDIYGIKLADTDGSTVQAAVVAANSQGTVTDAAYSGVGYYYGSNSTLNAEQVTTKLTVDLGNTGRYDTTEKYAGIVAVKGSTTAENVLIGANGTNNTLYGGAGGANTLYGGGAGNDVLVGVAGTMDTYGFGTGSGDDVVNNFVVTEDVVNAVSGGAVSGTRNSNQAVITWDDGSTLTLNNTAKATVNVDTAIKYTAGSDTTIRNMKLGLTNEANTFTYDGSNIFYGGSLTDTVEVTGSESNYVYMDGRLGQSFTNIEVLDASTSTGNNHLAGDAATNVIYGGSGTDSIWGGAGNVNDTMVGGSGANTFFFGMGEGNDVIAKYNDGDKVMLYNVSEANVYAGGLDAAGNMVITLTDGTTLNLNNYTSGGTTTFQLTDATYKYDKDNNTWVKQ